MPEETLLAHQVTGRGEPVLLLNGGLMTMAAWEPIAAALAADRKVVRCDLRGQLLSPGPAVTLAQQAEEVRRLLDALQVERIDVLGTSFGSFVAVLLAEQAPLRVRSLVLVTSTPRVSAEEWATTVPVVEAARAAAEGRGDGGIVFDLLRPHAYGAKFAARFAAALDERRGRISALPVFYFEGVAGLLASLEGLDLRPALAALRCPTLVLAAEEDRTFPLKRSRELAAAVAGARLEVVPEAGHVLVLEDPAAVVEAARRFWASL